MSRVRTIEGLCMLVSDTSEQGRLTAHPDHVYTSNVVYREVLPDHPEQPILDLEEEVLQMARQLADAAEQVSTPDEDDGVHTDDDEQSDQQPDQQPEQSTQPEQPTPPAHQLDQSVTEASQQLERVLSISRPAVNNTYNSEDEQG